MNDKQQLAAMGEHMSEQAAQPMCMAKRIEELEVQVRVMAELLRDLHEHIGTSIPQTVSEHYRGCDLLDRIDAALAGKMPDRVNLPRAMMPDDWVKGKYFPLHITTESGKTLYVAVDRNSGEVFVGGDAESSDAAKHFLREIGALSLVVVPKGWQLVPVEPTENMIGHGCGASVMVVSEVVKAWGAMLAASPSPDGAK